MKRLLGVLILTVLSFCCLIPGAESGSPRGKSVFRRDSFFDRADADRDGFMNWREYRDCRRSGSRGDFSRRDRDRDNRLDRDEWGSFDDRSDYWRSWR
ncbi:MAG: hypothetical protein V1789_02775 [PVC group bacterium]